MFTIYTLHQATKNIPDELNREQPEYMIADGPDLRYPFPPCSGLRDRLPHNIVKGRLIYL